jgi:hypothetical protein
MKDFDPEVVIGNALAILAGTFLYTCSGLIVLGAVLMCLAHPTGRYHVMSVPDSDGATSEVREDVRFGDDRVLFRGVSGKAWQVYFLIEGPRVEEPKVEQHQQSLPLREQVQL